MEPKLNPTLDRDPTLFLGTGRLARTKFEIRVCFTRGDPKLMMFSLDKSESKLDFLREGYFYGGGFFLETLTHFLLSISQLMCLAPSSSILGSVSVC